MEKVNVKLKDQSSVFADLGQGLTIVANRIVTAFKTQKVRDAIRAGALIQVEDDEFEKYTASLEKAEDDLVVDTTEQTPLVPLIPVIDPNAPSAEAGNIQTGAAGPEAGDLDAPLTEEQKALALAEDQKQLEADEEAKKGAAAPADATKPAAAKK